MPRVLLSSASLIALLAGGIAMPASIAAAPPEKPREAFDAATGRNLLNYPPHLLADVRHMRLTLRIPSMNDRTILASETLTIAPIAHDLSSVTLNAALLQISSVTCPGRTCTFTKSDADETLVIQLDHPISKGQTADISINYRIVDPPEGLMWTVESPAFPGRAAQIHSQGESESNRYWFAGHDFPNARATSELIVTVPRGFQVVSNGRLESTVQEKLEPFDTFHWVQDKPHAAYLVSLVVGKFDVVDVGTSKVPMPVYAPPGRGSDVRATFGRTPKMVELFGRVTDQPYPWAKYAQVCVNNFTWGGMENTSATTLYETTTLDKTALLDGDQDELISHELGHQWFGDLLTCKSWEHIWLNEGFATYVESLWAQYREASIPSSGRGVDGMRGNDAAYDAAIWTWLKDVIKNDTGEAPYQPAMASKEYDSPDDTFNRGANPYPKGALVLHMLRRRLGDEVFFRGLSDYVRTNKFKAVETFQFREAMEKAGGVSLQRFFDQWVYRPGVPKVKVTPMWDSAASTLTVNLEQTQTIDGYNPAFDLNVPVWVRCAGENTWRKLDARFEERKGSASLPLPSKPEMIVVDPEFTNLAKYDVAMTGAEWVEQAKTGPTTASRLRAVEALAAADADDMAGTETLAAIVRDEGALRDLRIEAAASLGKRNASGTTALRALLDARVADARVRTAIVEHAAASNVKTGEKELAPLTARLSQVFESDPSYGVRAAAVKGLGVLKAKSAMPTILKALDTNSQHDQIRKAGVEALSAIDDAEALPQVLRRATLGNSSAVRPSAVEALGTLNHHDPERVFNTLAALLDDREPKTALAAGKALADIGGARVKALFEHRLETLTSRAWKATTRQWLKEMDSEKKVEKAQAAAP